MRRRERGRGDDGVCYIHIYIYNILTAEGGKTDANLCNKFPGRFVYIIIICIPLHTYTIRVYNGQSGDINNANGGSTSRSNLAEDVVKVYIVRCVLIYTRPQVNLSYTWLVPADITCTGARADVVVLIA